uniref:NAC domain-containing protein n=1 Tax=Oryza punctata TaxID=4537 RepID=A0A0E0M7M8_ORYPU
MGWAMVTWAPIESNPTPGERARRRRRVAQRLLPSGHGGTGRREGNEQARVPAWPHGVRFVPEDLKLLAILDDKRRGSPSEAMFHDTQILDFHPAKLYEDEQEGYIYFFSTIQFRSKNMVERKAEGGRWKVNNCKTVASPLAITMNFYEHSGDNDPVRKRGEEQPESDDDTESSMNKRRRVQASAATLAAAVNYQPPLQGGEYYSGYSVFGFGNIGATRSRAPPRWRPRTSFVPIPPVGQLSSHLIKRKKKEEKKNRFHFFQIRRAAATRDTSSRLAASSPTVSNLRRLARPVDRARTAGLGMAAPEDGEDKNFGKNKHGLPIGYYFVPTDLELLAILEVKRLGRPLPRAHDAVFHDMRILDFHPAELYEKYAKDEEKGYIYFFSRREFPTLSKKRPLRAAEGGVWHGSGVYKAVKSKKSGGYDVGQKKTLVFYQRFTGDKEAVKTNWGIQEFTRIIGPQNEVPDLAVYRLYKIRKVGRETPADLAADAAAATMSKRRQASAAAMADQANVASTSKAYAPPQSSSSQLQQDTPPANAAGPSNLAPRPCNCRECSAVTICRAPPGAPGHYGYFASSLDRKGKGKAPMDCTEQAACGCGYAASTSTTAPPPQGIEYYGFSVAIGDEDDLRLLMEALFPAEEGGAHTVADERDTPQGSSPAVAAAASAPPVLDGVVPGEGNAGDDGRRGSPQGGHGSSTSSAAATAAGLDVPGGGDDDVSCWSFPWEELLSKDDHDGDDVTSAARAVDDVSGSQQEDHPAR